MVDYTGHIHAEPGLSPAPLLVSQSDNGTKMSCDVIAFIFEKQVMEDRVENRKLGAFLRVLAAAGGAADVGSDQLSGSC